jgi:hypothetical protein
MHPSKLSCIAGKCVPSGSRMFYCKDATLCRCIEAVIIPQDCAASWRHAELVLPATKPGASRYTHRTVRLH